MSEITQSNDVESSESAAGTALENTALDDSAIETTAGSGAAIPGADTAEIHATPTPPTKRTGAIFGGVVLLAIAAGATVWYLTATDDDPTTVTEPAQITAVTAEVRDLVEFTELDATLGYGDAFMIGPRVDGTVTTIAAVGERIERGDVLWEIDEAPTSLFYGTTPTHRPLSNGDSGDDVAMIEENLAALGFTADGAMVVDGVFDANTATAIEAWQDDIDAEIDGTIAIHDVHVEQGPITVDAVMARPGDAARAGGAIVEASLIESTTVLLATADGLITAVAPVGTGLATGTPLYEVDTEPIPVIVGEPIDRELAQGVEDGEDIEAFETVLVELGYHADGELEVDEVWDEATTDALLAWEEDLGIEEDGILQLEQYVGIEEPGSISTIEIERGDEIERGTAVATITEPTQVVTTNIDVADQGQLPLGARVDVEFPDGSVQEGSVVWIAAKSTAPVGQPDADPTIEVRIELDRIPESAASFAELDVTVLLVDDIASQVVAVPAAAIVSTGSAFAVEIVDGTTTRFVEVDPGMFADGWVEVAGIDAGTAVVVPS